MPSLNIRLSDQELLELRGRARMGRRSLQKQVVYELFHGRDVRDGLAVAAGVQLADAFNESGAEPVAAGSLSEGKEAVTPKSAPATLYAKDCRNADYHYKGPCRFCGGGNPL